MATIAGGGGNDGRELNRELPLVPFIDFLLCLVSFLLITAVWSQNARIEASARAPGVVEQTPQKVSRRLHVDVREKKFELTWKQGETVVARHDVPRAPVVVAGGQPSYPQLARQLEHEWQTSGVHKSPSDEQRDQVVLHSSNTLEFGELAAVMDAIHAPKRRRSQGAQASTIPVFAVTFAVN